MNVVLFGKGFGKPRQLSLSGPIAGLAATAFALVVMGSGFVGGYYYSSSTGSGVSNSELGELAGELDAQREYIAAI
ncbi:MAG: hypothetical protein OEZ11_09085, partial [Gammaproteobacteria bacterium]|nr:hypothetical protein [Gammaproteobacteria bacterium]